MTSIILVYITVWKRIAKMVQDYAIIYQNTLFVTDHIQQIINTVR